MPWMVLGAVALVLVSVGSSRPRPAAVPMVLRRVYRLVANTMGVPVPPLIATTSTNNAASDGFQVIYNPHWLSQVQSTLSFSPRCQEAAVVYLFAHELAHHRFGDAFNQGDSGVELEHRADYWAGVALQRLGFTWEEAACMLGMVGNACSASHGCPDERLAAVERGHADSACGFACVG